MFADQRLSFCLHRERTWLYKGKTCLHKKKSGVDYVRGSMEEAEQNALAALKEAAKASNNLHTPHVQDLLYGRKALNVKNLSKAALLLGCDLQIAFDRRTHPGADCGIRKLDYANWRIRHYLRSDFSFNK